MATQTPTAVIPIAGKGTRLAPLTRTLPKAMFPLVAPDGSVRPVGDWIAREALSAGCEKICFVTSAGQDGLLRDYFAGEDDLAGRIEYVTDVPAYGFGYAVWSAREACGGEAAIVFLGDHIHVPAPGQATPARQVATAFTASDGVAAVGVQVVDQAELHLVGACRGEPVVDNLYRCTEIIEKPSSAEAAKRLPTPGLPAGKYLAHAGIYALGGEIFDCLDRLVSQRRDGAEVGLTEAQRMLLARHEGRYLLRLIEGETYDTGTPRGYVRAQQSLLSGG